MVQHPATLLEDAVGATIQFFDRLVHRHAPVRHLFADEPQSVGGGDTGPSPYDLISAALGACTSMTLRLYADRKGLDLGRIQVDVSHEKVHARDGVGGGDSPVHPKIDCFTRMISVEGELTDELAKGLMALGIQKG